MDEPERLIGVVGPCKAGKSTLKKELVRLGYQCRHIAQEHSYVPEMWKILTNPDVLIYLDVGYQTTIDRGLKNWSEDEYQTQLERLSHARENADLIIKTDNLTVEELVKRVLDFLDHQ